MLLKEIEQPFNSKDYLYEIKFDGIRAIIFANPKSIKIISRNNKNITHLFPELHSIKKLVTKNTIFDGEIISMDQNLPSFSKLQTRYHLKDPSKINYQSLENPVIFICFDILYENKDLTNIPLEKRKQFLQKYSDNDNFLKSIYIQNDGIKLYLSAKKLGLEGIVAKKKDSKYHINQRTDDWLKIKNIKKDFFYIGGYIKNKNTTISLLLGEYHDQKLHFVGKVTIGPKNRLFEKILKMPLIKKNPFINLIDGALFIKPVIKEQVNFLERTKDNHLRHPFIS